MAETQMSAESGSAERGSATDQYPPPGPSDVVFDGPDYRLLRNPFGGLIARWRRRRERPLTLASVKQELMMALGKTPEESAETLTGSKNMAIDDVLDLPPPGPADIISESGFATKVVRPTEDGKGDRIVRI